MIVQIPGTWIQELKSKSKAIESLVRWNADKKVDLDLQKVPHDELDKLVEIALKHKTSGWRVVKTSVDSLKAIRAGGASGNSSIKNLKALQPALKAYIATSPNKWVFKRVDGHLLPYYVTDIQYQPPSNKGGYYSPPSVSMTLHAKNEEDQTTRFSSVKPKSTAISVLASVGLTLETPELIEAYEAQMEKFSGLVTEIGLQLAATGTGHYGARWEKEEQAMLRDGEPSRVVVDDDSEFDRQKGHEKYQFADDKFWRSTSSKGVSDDDDADADDDSDVVGEDGDGDENATVLPQHPWLTIFDLRTHRHMYIHVDDVTPYVYDESLDDKLVLPEDDREVLYALIRGANAVMEDIIKGKTGGTVLLCSGPPGVGKSLTAQVFSEVIKAPLYTVQCSQLGVEPDELEKELQTVLDRATRWKAILLIDEADVYIHERGTDLIQNAVVGVWLRVLEHYRGILFLTTNRSTVVDDAVMSRVTAWVRYKYPDETLLAKTWRVLSDQYKAGFADSEIDLLVKRWPQLSGRNIKNMLKLASQIRKTRKYKNVVDLFEHVARFLDLGVPTGEAREDSFASGR